MTTKARYGVEVDQSKGFTRSHKIYMILDRATNLWADDMEFTSRNEAAKYAAELNRKDRT